ncbi:N-acetylmuramoyl-L-alanine amidase [Clostridium cuniculi]|uniref:peptidoglycan recognition protein family protein n=1 Tax=Clostridium cuniculi TaxID=2548455 RepID=UPI001FAAF7AF|nr:N-acetylmuramoyl-L-alanine amidase [Clostridium cuniculi]
MQIIETNFKWNGSLSYTNKPKRIILHHAEASICTVQQIHSWHLGNGWTGIGYHFFVRKDGTIYRGRPENAIGAHVSGANTNTLGICAEGSYMTETMPVAQLNAIKWLIQYLDNKYGQLPIYGHREVGSSNCPGTNYPLGELKARKGFVQSETKVENVVVATSPVTETKSDIQKAKEYVGDRCKELQEKLIKCGYNCGGYGADGKFGQGTYDSLIQFQKDNGLVADGLAGVKTFAKLDELIAKKNSNSGDDWIRRLQQECNAQGFSNQSVDGIAGSKTLAGCPTLKKGASGNITKLLQERLGVTADGIFGGNTRAAVIGFQNTHGLSADGIVGKNTWRKLLGL